MKTILVFLAIFNDIDLSGPFGVENVCNVSQIQGWAPEKLRESDVFGNANVPKIVSFAELYTRYKSSLDVKMVRPHAACLSAPA